MNRIINPWTLEVDYQCGHTRQIEPRDSREHDYGTARLTEIIEQEAGLPCPACLNMTALQSAARMVLARLDLEAIEHPDAIFPAKALRDDLRAALLAEAIEPVDAAAIHARDHSAMLPTGRSWTICGYTIPEYE